MQSKNPVTNRAFGMAKLCEKLDIARPTVWRRLKDDPAFPRPLALGGPGSAKRWLESEVDQYLASKAAKRDGVSQ